MPNLRQAAVVLAPAATPADSSTFAVQAAPVPASMTSSASALPVGLVDQVFADLEQTGPFMQASACGCPGPQFSWEAGDWPLSGVLDLALLQASSGKPSGLAIFD